ncbi:MAG: hypothetical protein Q9162_004341 [Coniocarpon cinnabarinum]
MSRRFVNDIQTIRPDAQESSTLKVIAAGLPRAATSTLQHVFEKQLIARPSAPHGSTDTSSGSSPHHPYASSMHGIHIMPHNHIMKLECSFCDETSKVRRQSLIRQFYAGYNACSDLPGPAILEDLLELYPNAKIILNKRASAQAWERSIRESLAIYSTRVYFLATCLVPQSYWHYHIYRSWIGLCQRRFGTSDVFTAAFYEMQNQWVRDVVARDGRELLEWEPSMGLEPICEFLGCDVDPALGKELPTINEGAALRELKWFLFMRGLKAWAMLWGTVAVAGLGVVWTWR